MALSLLSLFHTHKYTHTHEHTFQEEQTDGSAQSYPSREGHCPGIVGHVTVENEERESVC